MIGCLAISPLTFEPGLPLGLLMQQSVATVALCTRYNIKNLIGITGFLPIFPLTFGRWLTYAEECGTSLQVEICNIKRSNSHWVSEVNCGDLVGLKFYAQAVVNGAQLLILQLHPDFLETFVNVQYFLHVMCLADSANWFCRYGDHILCLADCNNWYCRYGDGVSWHDAACYRTKQFVCEDSDKMVTPRSMRMGMRICGWNEERWWGYGCGWGWGQRWLTFHKKAVCLGGLQKMVTLLTSMMKLGVWMTWWCRWGLGTA